MKLNSKEEKMGPELKKEKRLVLQGNQISSVVRVIFINSHQEISYLHEREILHHLLAWLAWPPKDHN